MFLLEDFPELLCDSSHSLLSSSGEGNTGLYIYTCMISSVVVLNRHQEIREEWSQLGLKTRIGSYCYIMYVSCKPYWCFYNASRITFRLRLFLSRLFSYSRCVCADKNRLNLHISVVCRNTCCQLLFWKLGSMDCELIQSKTLRSVVS